MSIITNDYSYFINDIYGRVQGFELSIRKVAHGAESGFWHAQLYRILSRREKAPVEIWAI